MIILKLMALSILIPAYIWGIARFIHTSASGKMEGDLAILGAIHLIITGTASAAIIQTML